MLRELACQPTKHFGAKPGEPSAIDYKCLAGNVLALIAGEKVVYANQVVNLGDSPER